MTPTLRAAAVVAVVGTAALLLSPALVLVVLAVVVTLIGVDMAFSRPPPSVERKVAAVMARGVPSELGIRTVGRPGTTIRVRQPAVPDLTVEPSEADGDIEGRIMPRRRGHHTLPAVAVRSVGPLGLGAWTRTLGEPVDIDVYPDLPAARRIAVAIRRGKFRAPGKRTRGPLGLGTDFESIRDYEPDDDIRQVNWRASARLGRPMSNQFRVESERDVIALIDTGRLMAAPIGDATRLDVALDALAAVAMVTDEVGDRCGVVAFDREVVRSVTPGRATGRQVIRATHALEPHSVEADYDRAFRAVASHKRAFVMVLTDLLDEAAARSLLRAVPVLVRRHVVVVAGSTDPDLIAAVDSPRADDRGVYRSVVARDVLARRSHAAALLRSAGAEVLEAPPDRLAATCVASYLRAKSRIRL